MVTVVIVIYQLIIRLYQLTAIVVTEFLQVVIAVILI